MIETVRELLGNVSRFDFQQVGKDLPYDLYEQLTGYENRFGGTIVPAGTMVAAISKFVPTGTAPRSSH